MRPGGSVAPGTDPIDTDVLVVGLGPVGATLANLLGRYDVKVLAIDQAFEIFTKPRAIALDNEALRILQLAGVHDGEFSTVGIRPDRCVMPKVPWTRRTSCLVTCCNCWVQPRFDNYEACSTACLSS